MIINESFSSLVGIEKNNLSKLEKIILEFELLLFFFENLKDNFKETFKEYFGTIKLQIKEQKKMTEILFLSSLIKDMLSNNEYTLSGIALYTGIPEEVIYELACGINVDPSSSSLIKLIKLHMTIRPELYKNIIKKICMEKFLITTN